jgi:ATP-binding cassette subfamily B protein
VLDEATSSLDSENEQLVQQSLAELTASAAATFIVAHRLSTLSIADRIIVLHDGAIVQEGTFAALSSSPGLFRDLLAAQDGRHGPPRPGGRPPMKREPMMRGHVQ